MITLNINLVSKLINLVLTFFIFRTLALVGLALVIVHIAYSDIEKQKDADVQMHLELIAKKYTPEFIASNQYNTERERLYKRICGTRPEVRCSSEGYSHIDYMNHRYDDVFIRHARLSKNQ